MFLFVCLFVCSFVCSFVRSFVRSFEGVLGRRLRCWKGACIIDSPYLGNFYIFECRVFLVDPLDLRINRKLSITLEWYHNFDLKFVCRCEND